MDWNVMAEVMMSAVFFAPLLIALGAVLFVGGLVAFEGVVALVRGHALLGEGVGVDANLEVGPVVAGLKAAVEEEVVAAHATPENEKGSKANHG